MLQPVEQDDRVEALGKRALEPFMRVADLEREPLAIAEMLARPADRGLMAVDAGDRGRAEAGGATGALLVHAAPPPVLARRHGACAAPRTTLDDVAPPHGRSAALLVATEEAGRFALTITASTVRPVHAAWAAAPSRDALDAYISDLPAALWHDDVYGAPAWRRHMTRRLAAELHEELLG